MNNTQMKVLSRLSNSAETMFQLKQDCGFDSVISYELMDAGLIKRLHGPSGVYAITLRGRRYLAVRAQEVG
jgi:hypothetical protein